MDQTCVNQALSFEQYGRFVCCVLTKKLRCQMPTLMGRKIISFSICGAFTEYKIIYIYQHCYNIIDNAYDLVLCNYIMCQDAKNKSKINKHEKRLDEVLIVEGFCNCPGITKKVVYSLLQCS